MENPMDLKERMLPAPVGGGFRMEGYWVWCGTVMKGEDNRYHMFASRWPKSQPMHPGWLSLSEIVRASSDTPEGPYQFEEVVLPARGAEYWDGRMTHNPQITKWGDTYVLYYIGSTHPFPDLKEGEQLVHNDSRSIVARANKRVGIATAKSVFGPWTRSDRPILPTRPGHFDNFLTSNPAPCIGEDGSVVLLFKARSYKPMPYTGDTYGRMTIGAAMAKDVLGPYHVMQETPLFVDESIEIEDPFIWKEGPYYQMIAKDMHGNICGETYGGVHGYSENGLDWTLNMGELTYSRHVLWDDGKVRQMGNLDRPFLLFENGKATHMFFATSDGTESFFDAENTWNMVIPLKQY